LGQRGLGNLEGLWELNFSKPFYLWKIARRSVGLIKEQLEKVNARLLGVVLNGVKKGDYKRYYNYRFNYEKKGAKGML
jgi:hypothetical protein